MERIDGRKENQLREIKITRDFNIHAEGSVLIESGNTKVICTASVSEKVPSFIKNTGKGWLTAEYSMIPRATGERNQREAAKGKLSGRTMEIQRLIGRALRSSIDLEKLGERTITLDCDVIQADGGTRTASITGAFVAMAIAAAKLLREGTITESPVLSSVAAVSVGKCEGNIFLDLNYVEDSSAEVDMNVIQNDLGEYIEVQGTGEEATFCRKELNTLLDMAEIGIHQLLEKQREVLGEDYEIIFSNRK